MFLFVPVLATISLVHMTVGDFTWFGAITKLERRRDDVCKVEVYCGGQEVFDENGGLRRGSIETVYADCKARDPATGRLILDELCELFKSTKNMVVRLKKHNGLPYITMLQDLPGANTFYLRPPPPTVCEASWFGAITKLEEGRNGVWTVTVYCQNREVPDQFAELRRQFTRTVYVDAKAKDWATGALILDQLRELLQSKKLMIVRLKKRNDGAPYITMLEDMKGVKPSYLRSQGK